MPQKLVPEARWQSGYAAACKAVYAGSIPTLASNIPRSRGIFLPLPWPVASSMAFDKWGTVTLEAQNCASILVTMNTQEGNKVSATIKIIGVAGLVCVD